MSSTSLLWNSLSPGRQRIGKLAGKTDMGGSAPCSKIGLAHVRKGGVRWMKSGLKYRPWPCLGHATPGAGTGNATLPAHSPNMAHACVQSSGVLTVQPRSGVRSNPPSKASDGSAGTAEGSRFD